MAYRREARPILDVDEAPLDLPFEARRHGDVLDLTAAAAHEVVVMLREVFGKLVPAELLVRHHAMDRPGLFEHGEVPVQGALREGAPAREVGNGHRVLRLHQGLDESSALRCIALPDRSEPELDPRVQLRVHSPAPSA